MTELQRQVHLHETAEKVVAIGTNASLSQIAAAWPLIVHEAELALSPTEESVDQA